MCPLGFDGVLVSADDVAEFLVLEGFEEDLVIIFGCGVVVVVGKTVGVH